VAQLRAGVAASTEWCCGVATVTTVRRNCLLFSYAASVNDVDSKDVSPNQAIQARSKTLQKAKGPGQGHSPNKWNELRAIQEAHMEGLGTAR
jgi:hypothetical protein